MCTLQLAELQATIEAERHDLEELERLRRMQREAAQAEHSRILDSQREQLEADKAAAKAARLAAEQVWRQRSRESYTLTSGFSLQALGVCFVIWLWLWLCAPVSWFMDSWNTQHLGLHVGFEGCRC